MAFPTIPTVASGRVLVANQADTTPTRTFPAFSGLTYNDGDLLVAIVVGYQSTAGAFSSWSNGFNEFTDQFTSTTLAIGAAYKIASGTESGSLTVTQSATITGHASMILMAIPGAHQTTAPEAGTIDNNTAAAADPGSFNPAGWGTEDTLWISVIASGMTASGGTWTATGTTAPTNYTDRVDTNTTDNSTVGQTELAVAFRQLNAASEDVGTGGVDVSNARNSALVIAIRPAPSVTQTYAHAQAQAWIKQTYNAFGQAQAALRGSVEQKAYRGYFDDGALGSATPKANENTGWVQQLDQNFRVRFLIQETAGGPVPNTFYVRYRRNGGSQVSVTSTSTFVRVSNGIPADNLNTASILSSGTGTFAAGKYDDVDGNFSGANIPSSGYTEHEICLTLRSVDGWVQGDLVELRLRKDLGGTVLETYTAWPTFTVGNPQGSGQAQAWIKQTYNSYGQALANIDTNAYRVADTFTRSTSPGLGTADTGGTYNTSPTQLTTNGSRAIFDPSDTSTITTSLPQVTIKYQIHGSFDFIIPSAGAGTGNSIFSINSSNGHIGVGLDVALSSGLYSFFVQAGPDIILIFEEGGPLSFNTLYRIKYQLNIAPTENTAITDVRYKIYLAASSEPGWTVGPVAYTVATGNFGYPILSFKGGNATSSIEIDNLDINDGWPEWGQAQARIKQIYNSSAQAQANIKTTYYNFAQAQAQIKQFYFVHGQTQARIKNTYRGFGQAQAEIQIIVPVDTYEAFGQAQAQIKQTYQVFAQAQSWIEQIYNQFGQAQADIKQIYNQAAQAQADIKQVYYDHANAQALIKNTYVGCGQAEAWIKQVYYGHGQAQACVKGNVFGQAQARIENTYVACGQSEAWIEATYNQHANVQGTILQAYNQSGNAQATIKQTYDAHGQAQAVITQTYQAYAQAQAKINAYGVNAFGQAQGNIRSEGNFGHGQAQAKINAFDYPQHGQAQAWIEATYNQSGNAQGTILQTYNACGQAQACIKGNAFGQAQADILQTYIVCGNAQAQIKQTYQAYAQAEAWIKNTYQQYANAQAWIEQTYQQYANAQATILQTYYGHGQAQACVKGNAFAQAQAWIENTYNQSGNAQAQIRQIYNQHANVQAKINAFDVCQFGQAQAVILSGIQRFAQAQAKINAFGVQSYGQAQAWIESTYNQFGQTQGTIKQTYTVCGNAQGSIKQTYNVYANAQGWIENTYSQHGNAQSWIENTYNQSGNTQGNIKATYFVYAQAQALIGVRSEQYGQAQATIKAITSSCGQAQADIKAIYVVCGNAQARIKNTYQSYGQAQALISIIQIGVGQAQGTILTVTNSTGNAQAQIKQTYNQHANAQGHIRIRVNTYGQAQGWIEAVTSQFGQAIAYITSGSRGLGQAQALIVRLDINVYGNANAFISKSAGYGQSEAIIVTVFILKRISTLSDRPSMDLTLSDSEIGRISLILSDTNIILTLSDKNY